VPARTMDLDQSKTKAKQDKQLDSFVEIIIRKIITLSPQSDFVVSPAIERSKRPCLALEIFVSQLDRSLVSYKINSRSYVQS
jgi:hypothetical protein